jgi:glutathione S-transferase
MPRPGLIKHLRSVQAGGMDKPSPDSPATDVPVLWHIPLSHYSEKARWALDYKGIPHRRQTLGPDYLIRVWRATGHGTLPVLWPDGLDGQAVGDSTHIIAALEARYPEPPLYPADPAQRKYALELEDYLDEGLGPALRAAIITPLFQNDPEAALRVLMTGMPDKAYKMLRRILPVFPWYYRKRHKIVDADLEKNRAIVAEALDRVERERAGRPYLVGDSFTVADLTAAALLGALIAPPEIQYPQKGDRRPYHESYRAKILAHPTAKWAAEIYRKHRGRSLEIPRRATGPVAAAARSG